ncbi:MAG: hypothetical protein AAB492_02080 [Patescibacteria group bacterium]
MNTLPTQASTDPQPTTPIVGVSVGKEVEHASDVLAEVTLGVEQGKDIELPHEVSAIGVRVQPTIVVLPTVVQHAGVQAINPAAPVAPFTPAAKMPLSDDQIAKGLHESVVNSVRWLTEWCVRRLKQLQLYARPSI